MLEYRKLIAEVVIGTDGWPYLKTIPVISIRLGPRGILYSKFLLVSKTFSYLVGMWRPKGGIPITNPVEVGE